MGAKFDREKWLDPKTFHSTEESSAKTRMQNDEFMLAHEHNVIDSLVWNIDNLRARGNYVDKIYGQVNGGAALVCGAGPSLYSEIENIKKAKESGYAIIAVDRAFSFLKKNGVRPDLTVSCDPQPEVAKFYQEFREGDVCSLSLFCHPSVLFWASQGRYFWHCDLVPPAHSSFMAAVYKRFGFRIANVRPGRVVTHAALDIATWMGFDTIVTIGNELSFDSVEQMNDYLGLIAEPIFHNERVTFAAFDEAALAFAQKQLFHKDEVKYVDASLKGITPGWARMSLTEILAITKQKAEATNDVDKVDSVGTANTTGNSSVILQ